MTFNQISCFILFILIIQCNGLPRFANYFQDYMVLQRAPQRAVVWGYGDSNVLTTLTIGNKTYTTISQSTPENLQGNSIWSLTLDPQEGGPFNIHVSQPSQSGSVTISLSQVLFGDVWVCSGQSNMQLTVNMIYNGSLEIANAGSYPNIRLFTVSLIPSDQPVEELLGIDLKWSVASPSNIDGPHWTYMSAVCWLFGRMIHQALNGRPIGLIATSWGGTAIEFWMSPETLQKCNTTINTKINIEPFNENTTSLSLNPSNLYNSMIYPFTRMVIFGVIWYQGEANADYNTNKYTCSFNNMISSWRQTWNQRTNGINNATFPFGFVQLSTYTSDSTKIGGFPWIRWHQTFDQGYVPNYINPNVFMAVAVDLRDDPNGIHPRYKHDVGYRLSRAALAVAYGQSVEFMGPIVRGVIYSSNTQTINITYGSVSSIDQRTSDGFDVCCLANLCFNDSTWQTTIITERINMTIAVAVPKSCFGQSIFGVRYLWRETPCPFKRAPLYSGTDPNLPSPPFYYQFPPSSQTF